jgi:protein TonB
MQPPDVTTDIEDITAEDIDRESEIIEHFADAEYGSEETLDGRLIVRGLPELPDLRKDKILKYSVATSLILHLAAVAALPLVADLAPTSSFLKPGEKVERVRLVDFQRPKKPEPPPEKAAAISDRDHTAKRERLTKAPTGSPLGRIINRPRRMAALQPPPAPEDLIKPKSVPKPKKEKAKLPQKKKIEKIEKKASATGEKPDPKQRDPLKPPSPYVDLRPTPNEIRQGLMASRGTPNYFLEGNPDEAVVDINTREEKYYSYLFHLKKKIEGVWVYPRIAAESGLGGALILEFSIARNGDLLGVNLLDSSGHTILDEYAMKAIRTAAPYFPFPERMKHKRLRIRANFIYVTGGRFRRTM